MSYNCDHWKTKKLKDFAIPVASLFKGERNNWHPKQFNNNDGSVTFEIMETTLDGIIKDNWLFVSKVDCSGEGSGTAMRYILEPAFKDSIGELVASCIWECGDSINKITVKHGIVSWEDIKI